MDFLREAKMCSQEVRRMEVMRLLGDKVNPHNRIRKNRLCGFIFDLCEQNIECSFSGFSGYCGFWKTAETAITADRNGRIGDSGNSRTSDSGSMVEDSQQLSSHQS